MNRTVLAAYLALYLAVSGCKLLENQPVLLEHRRPANVPDDAALVDQPKGGLWQRCVAEKEGNANRCQIYNWGGALLYDEVFLPYDGGGAVNQVDIKIPRYAPLSGPDRVCLQNGRILIPKSRYDEVKRHLDWATGRRTQP